MLALTSEAEDDHCPNGGFRDDLLVLCFCRLLFFRSRSSLAVMRNGTSLATLIRSTCRLG
jgi:hypothetical protein